MRHSSLRLSSPLLRYVAMAVDVFIVWACGLAAYLWYQGTSSQPVLLPRYQVVMLVASLMLLVCSKGLYRSWRVNELWVILRTVTVTWLSVAFMVLVALFFTKISADFSRVWYVVWVFSTLIVLCLERLLVYSVLRRLRVQGYNFKTVVLVGNGRLSQSVHEALADSVWSGLRVVATLPRDGLAGFMANPPDKRPVDEVWLCLPLRGCVKIN